MMRQPPERRAELYAEGLKRIARSGENDFRRFLLAECLEAYADLDAAQKGQLQALLQTEAYREVKPLMKTTYERGMEAGIDKGERRAALWQMEAKFGPLDPHVKERVESLPTEALARLLIDLLRAQTIEELGLGN